MDGGKAISLIANNSENLWDFEYEKSPIKKLSSFPPLICIPTTAGTGAETDKILNNLVGALPDFDLSLDDLVSATIYTTEFDEFPAINAAWERVFTADVQLPARTSIGVKALPLGATVEIEFMFYKA